MKFFLVGLFVLLLSSFAAAPTVDITGVVAPYCTNAEITGTCLCGMQAVTTGFCCGGSHRDAATCSTNQQCNDGNPATTDTCIMPNSCGAVCSNIVPGLCGNGSTDSGENCSSCPADVGCGNGMTCEAGGCIVPQSNNPAGDQGGGGGGGSSSGDDPSKSGALKFNKSKILIDEIVAISSYCQWALGCELRIDGNVIFQLERSGGFREFKTKFSTVGNRKVELVNKGSPEKLVAVKTLAVVGADDETGVGITQLSEQGFEISYEKIIDFGSTQKLILKTPENIEEGQWEITVIAPDGEKTEIETDGEGIAYVTANIPGTYFFTAKYLDYEARGIFTVRNPTVLNGAIPGGGETIEKIFGQEASVNIFYLSILVIGWFMLLLLSFRLGTIVVGGGFFRKAIFAILFAIIPIVANYVASPLAVTLIVSLQLFGIGLVEFLVLRGKKQGKTAV